MRSVWLVLLFFLCAGLPGRLDARSDGQASGVVRALPSLSPALSRIGRDAAVAVPHLSHVLRDPELGSVAATAIGKIGSKPALPALLAEPDPKLRAKAAALLGAIGAKTPQVDDDRIDAALRVALTDSSAEVRRNAEWTLRARLARRREMENHR